MEHAQLKVVMFPYVFLMLLPLVAAVQRLQDPSHFLQNETALWVEQFSWNTSWACGSELAVVILPSSAVPPELLARTWLNEWHLTCNGTVVVWVLQQRQWFIATGSTTTEFLQDDEIRQAMQDVTPLLRDAQYDKAIKTLLPLLWQALLSDPSSDASFNWAWLILIVPGAVIVVASCACVCCPKPTRVHPHKATPHTRRRDHGTTVDTADAGYTGDILRIPRGHDVNAGGHTEGGCGGGFDGGSIDVGSFDGGDGGGGGAGGDW